MRQRTVPAVCEHVFVCRRPIPYVELHCHSAYSFLDGASQPEELVAAAISRGHDGARAHRPRLAVGLDGVRAGGAVAGPAGDPRGGGHARRRPPPHAARPRRDRLAQPLPAADARPRPHARRAAARPHASPPSRSTTSRRTTHGLVCLSGCARSGVRDEPTMRRLLAIFGRDAFRVELQRPLPRHDRALNRGLAGLAERLGVATVATGNVHAHSPERAACRTRSWRSASTRRSTPPSRCGAATTPTC